MRFIAFRQLDAMDCGPTCLRMIAKFYGRDVSMDFLRKKTEIGKDGVSLLGMANAAENIGLRPIGLKLTFDQLCNSKFPPSILHWDQSHFVVLTPLSNRKRIVIADPAKGLVKLKREVFEKNWITSSSKFSKSTGVGIALMLEPTASFFQFKLSKEQEQEINSKISWKYLIGIVRIYRKQFIQVFIGLLFGSLLQLILPFLTQAIVDNGINAHDIDFIELILCAQLMLLFSQTIIQFIRSHILLFVSILINVSLLSIFWQKLLKLPMSFFDAKHPGDIFQRITDHQRIQSFLTDSAINMLFSVFNLIVFSIVILSYNKEIFFVFFFSSCLYILWISLFIKYRRGLDFRQFAVASKENNATIQMIYGAQEIKLNNAEVTFRWAWERLQTGLFRLSFERLSLSQYQQGGAFFINQAKNFIITFLVAKQVVEGNLTLGAMMSIQFIMGQLNSPIENLIGFTQMAQDAKISLERINDIHSLQNEELPNIEYLRYLPISHTIQIRNLSFTYPGAGNDPILKNINMDIEQGKVTAIVGMSGSGKTTLLKLLLKYYESYSGKIYLEEIDLKLMSPNYWRSKSGAVLQDSYIFDDTIKKNIMILDEELDNEKLLNACKIANILPFIEALPLGFDTKIGQEGIGISGGQKQRILIARAVYKNPEFIFFDEATNSLDSTNEKTILQNLENFYLGKSVVVVAHRLSTVKNAHKIIVLEDGCIVEEGNHDYLIGLKGKYYKLIENQLKFGE